MWKGRFDESQKELEYNLSISPLSPHVNTSRGVFAYFTRQYDSAITWCREALELDPAFYPAYAALGLAYLQKGMHKEAIEALERVFKMSNEPEALSMLGYALARVGRKDEARGIICKLEELSHQRYVKPYHFAIIYVALDEAGLAFDWLEKAFEDRNDLMTVIKIGPRLDALRNDPRLNNLIQRMGL